MRSALLEVEGVTRVQVSLEESKALVTYDARATGVDVLVAAINGADGPQGPTPYTAAVDGVPRAATSAR